MFGTELYIFNFLLNGLVSVGNRAQATLIRLLVAEVAPEYDKNLTGSLTFSYGLESGSGSAFDGFKGVPETRHGFE